MHKIKIRCLLFKVIDIISLIIVLFTLIQKIGDNSEEFKHWITQKKFSYQTNALISQSQRLLGKRILVITFNLQDAGAPLMFLWLAKILHQKGYNVSVLSYAGGRHEKDLKKAKIPYLISKEHFTGSKETEKLLNSFDLVISGRIPQVYFPSQEYKFIWWDHGLLNCISPKNIFNEAEENSLSKEITFLTEKAQDVVFVSELQQKKLAECRNLPSEVISNGLNPTEKKMNDPVIKQMEKAKKTGKIIFVTVASINFLKGHDVLVDAVTFLDKETRKKAVFFVVGPQKNKKYADFLYKQSKDIPEIIWAGPVPHEKIGGVYEMADVLVVPSRSDTAPLVIQEAAEHYTPSIITDNVGSTFIVKDFESGFIVHKNNPAELADKIRFFIDNPAVIKEFGKNARHHYEETSSFDVFTSKWEDKIKRKFKEIKEQR